MCRVFFPPPPFPPHRARRGREILHYYYNRGTGGEPERLTARARNELCHGHYAEIIPAADFISRVHEAAGSRIYSSLSKSRHVTVLCQVQWP